MPEQYGATRGREDELPPPYSENDPYALPPTYEQTMTEMSAASRFDGMRVFRKCAGHYRQNAYQRGECIEQVRDIRVLAGRTPGNVHFTWTSEGRLYGVKVTSEDCVTTYQGKSKYQVFLTDAVIMAKAASIQAYLPHTLISVGNVIQLGGVVTRNI